MTRIVMLFNMVKVIDWIVADYNNDIMKMLISILLAFVFISVSCTNQAGSKTTPNTTDESKAYKGPIIDMHIHAFNDDNMMFGMTHPPTLRGETFEGVTSALEQKEKCLEIFREYNIVKAMVANGELWINDAPEIVLIGNANKSIEELSEEFKNGKLQVIGEMAPFYAGKLADDPSVVPYFELAQKLDIPVGFHVFPGGPNYGIHLMPEMLGGMRTYNANPQQLENILIKFPNLKLYIMHGGWPYVEEIKALMYAHPNVYIDIAVVNWILPQEEFEAYLKSLINAGFGDRIMFGSDQMVWPQVITVGIESVNNTDFLTLDQKEDIFYNNAAEFLNLSKEEIEKHKTH